MQLRAGLLLGLLSVSATPFAGSQGPESAEPSTFALDLSDLVAMADDCGSAGVPEILDGFELTPGACRELSAAAHELELAALERDLSSFDRGLLTENLLYLSRNTSLTRGRDGVISSEDVQFGEVSFILERIGWRKPRGFLIVDSEPRKSGIRIDDDYKGYTIQRFVLSPGIHQVTVINKSERLSCKKDIRIEEDRESFYSCPEG